MRGMMMDERHKLEVLEMQCLLSMSGVTRLDSWWNEEVRRRVAVTEKMSDAVDREVLNWFGHMQRMSGKR